jgi:hypothetical protein
MSNSKSERSFIDQITPQKLLAGVFIGLGTWCIISPSTMFQLSIRPTMLPLITPVTTFFAQCFGAQAVLAGTLLGKYA